MRSSRRRRSTTTTTCNGRKGALILGHACFQSCGTETVPLSSNPMGERASLVLAGPFCRCGQAGAAYASDGVTYTWVGLASKRRRFVTMRGSAFVRPPIALDTDLLLHHYEGLAHYLGSKRAMNQSASS
jgi:hypothetical protein